MFLLIWKVTFIRFRILALYTVLTLANRFVPGLLCTLKVLLWINLLLLNLPIQFQKVFARLLASGKKYIGSKTATPRLWNQRPGLKWSLSRFSVMWTQTGLLSVNWENQYLLDKVKWESDDIMQVTFSNQCLAPTTDDTKWNP